jgi:AcrR family transcriptional regulator
MPKGFSQQEKLQIMQKINAVGKELFSSYGLKKTTIEDITRASGISKGAFYLFYASKEELFMEILEAADQEIKAAMRQALLPEEKPSQASYQAAILQMLQAMQEHPLLKIFKSDEYEYLMRRLDPKIAAEHVATDAAYFRLLYTEGFERSYFRAVDPDTFTYFATALYILSLHRDQSAVFQFEKMVTILTDMFTQHIIAP